jgi:hypothetical protein
MVGMIKTTDIKYTTLRECYTDRLVRIDWTCVPLFEYFWIRYEAPLTGLDANVVGYKVPLAQGEKIYLYRFYGKHPFEW